MKDSITRISTKIALALGFIQESMYMTTSSVRNSGDFTEPLGNGREVT